MEAEIDIDIEKVAALRDFSMQGVYYRKGDPVNVAGLPDHKIHQLLRQRFIRPVPPDA